MKILALASILAACSGSPNQTPDARVIIDASHDAPHDTSSDAAAKPKVGMIEVSQGTGGGSADSGATAQFGATIFGAVVGTDGPCTAYSAGPLDGYSAGAITITGTISTITMTPSGVAPNVHYTAGPVPKPAFTGGAPISISAAGGADVPAFTAGLNAPATLAGFTPPTTTISRSGYTATWTAGAGPTIWVITAGFNTTTNEGVVAVCRVTDTGTFTIPASTFAMIPAGDDTAFVGVGRVAPTTVNTGGVMITVQATSYITSGGLTLGT